MKIYQLFINYYFSFLSLFSFKFPQILIFNNIRARVPKTGEVPTTTSWTFHLVMQKVESAIVARRHASSSLESDDEFIDVQNAGYPRIIAEITNTARRSEARSSPNRKQQLRAHAKYVAQWKHRRFGITRRPQSEIIHHWRNNMGIPILDPSRSSLHCVPDPWICRHWVSEIFAEVFLYVLQNRLTTWLPKTADIYVWTMFEKSSMLFRPSANWRYLKKTGPRKFAREFPRRL